MLDPAAGVKENQRELGVRTRKMLSLRFKGEGEACSGERPKAALKQRELAVHQDRTLVTGGEKL